MMKGFSGEAGPRKGADQTIAGLFRRASQRIILRPADRERSGPGWRRARCTGRDRLVGVGSDVGPHFVCAAPPPPILPDCPLRCLPTPAPRDRLADSIWRHAALPPCQYLLAVFFGRL